MSQHFHLNDRDFGVLKQQAAAQTERPKLVHGLRKSPGGLLESVMLPQATEVRELHIPNEMSMLSAAIDDLIALTCSLGERLEPICAPAISQAACGADAPDSYRVPLADVIRSQRRRVNDAVDRLRCLREGLEL